MALNYYNSYYNIHRFTRVPILWGQKVFKSLQAYEKEAMIFTPNFH